MSEPKISWAEKNPDETYTVDVFRLLFDIILNECCIVGLLRNADSKGSFLSTKDLIEKRKALVLNLRYIPKMMVARGFYHGFYKSDEYPWREGWKAAWEHADYLFTVDLDEEYKHLEDVPIVSKEEGLKH